MGLFSFLQGSSASDSERTGTTDPVQAARSRARRRLIGAAVLLGVGVIGFPLLFETQPRPIPVDIPIEIPRKEGAPSLPLPPPRTASAAPAVMGRVSSGVTTEAARPAPASAPPVAAARSDVTPGRTETGPKAAAPTKAEATKAEAPKAEAPKAEAPKAEAPKAEAPKAAARADDGARARALLEGQGSSGSEANKSTAVAAATPKADATPKPDAAKPDAAGGRFVVQVGAYGEASSARDMRQRVDKLGLKSYTQTADVDGAKRIRVRVGPFSSREDAEKAAGTLKAAGLPAAIMTL
jgi:DedD protein